MPTGCLPPLASLRSLSLKLNEIKTLSYPEMDYSWHIWRKTAQASLSIFDKFQNFSFWEINYFQPYKHFHRHNVTSFSLLYLLFLRQVFWRTIFSISIVREHHTETPRKHSRFNYRLQIHMKKQIDSENNYILFPEMCQKSSLSHSQYFSFLILYTWLKYLHFLHIPAESLGHLLHKNSLPSGCFLD